MLRLRVGIYVLLLRTVCWFCDQVFLKYLRKCFLFPARKYLIDDCVLNKSPHDVVNAFAQKDISRANVFVPMERGEFNACEAQMKSPAVYAGTSADFIHSLVD